MSAADELRAMADYIPTAHELRDLAERFEAMADELERTRQAWVDGADPMCEDVCTVACKGPCGVTT